MGSEVLPVTAKAAAGAVGETGAVTAVEEDRDHSKGPAAGPPAVVQSYIERPWLWDGPLAIFAPAALSLLLLASAARMTLISCAMHWSWSQNSYHHGL